MCRTNRLLTLPAKHVQIKSRFLRFDLFIKVLKLKQKPAFSYLASGTTSTSNKTSKAKAFSSGPLETKVVGTKILKKGLKLCEDWDLSIDLKLPNQSNLIWRNFFGLQVEGTADQKPGSRVPAVFIQQDKAEVSYTPFGTESNHVFNFPTFIKFNTGSWINLKISQNNKVYEIKVDDKLVHKEINSKPEAWSNVKVVIGSPTGSGEYRNFEIYTDLYSCSSGKTSSGEVQ